MDQYKLDPLVVHNGHALDGLPQNGKLANDRLVKHLTQYSHVQAKHTPSLFTHTTSPIIFSLFVDDFGVQ
jgi:hypothetical protein